ncbi:MAG TPA: hypothetical protein V6C97_04465 [Oculatellaceae cyanobacterium]
MCVCDVCLSLCVFVCVCLTIHCMTHLKLKESILQSKPLFYFKTEPTFVCSVTHVYKQQFCSQRFFWNLKVYTERKVAQN